MKKKFLTVLSVVAVVALAAYGLQANNEEVVLSEMALEYVEALAAVDPINPNCPDGCLTKAGYCYCNGDHPYEPKKWKDEN